MRRTNHAIADIVFGPAGSSLFCQCGEDFHARREDQLNELYQRHRVAMGEQRRSFSSSELNAPGDPIVWRDRGTITSHEAQRKYRLRHPERVAEQQRRYREKRKAVAA